MDNDGTDLLAFLAVILIAFFIVSGIHQAPQLDNPEKPYIVKKVKESVVSNGYSKYYGKTQDAFSPKPLILKTGRYNVGDTIYFGKR